MIEVILSWAEQTIGKLSVLQRAELDELREGDIVMTHPGVYWAVRERWAETTDQGRASRLRLEQVTPHAMGQRTRVTTLPRPDHERRG